MEAPNIAESPVETTVKSGIEGMSLPRLDAMFGQTTETQTPPPDTQTPPTQEEKKTEEPKSGIRKITEEAPAKEEKPGEGKETKPAAETKTAEPTDDESVDLDEVVIEHEGKELPVSQLITELTSSMGALKERVAQIDKDPFLKGFIDHYLANGNAAAYLEARGVDYDKKSDLEVLKMQFDKTNADLNEKTRELLWKRELKEKYKVNADLSDEEKQTEEYQIGQAMLERDAKNARKTFKDEQSKFQITERKVEEKPATPQFDPEAYKKKLLQEKDVATFMKSKLLKIGVKDEAGNQFAFEPENPGGIIEMMTDDRKFWAQFAPEGKADYNKLMRMYAYSLDPDKYDQQLVEFGKDLQLQERLKEEKNTDGRLNKQTTQSQTKGTDEVTGILKAMEAAKRNKS